MSGLSGSDVEILLNRRVISGSAVENLLAYSFSLLLRLGFDEQHHRSCAIVHQHAKKNISTPLTGKLAGLVEA